MDDIAKIQRRVEMLRTTNADITREIESLGVAVEVTVARIEHLVGYLVDLGVITEIDRWREQEKWERALKEQLVPVVQRARANPSKNKLN